MLSLAAKVAYEEGEVRRKWRLANAVVDPFSLFTVDVDFVAGTTVGSGAAVAQAYGNNNNDGRPFRDPSNVSQTYCPAASGLLVPVASAGLRRTDRGVWGYMSGTNSLLWNRDLTNAVWTKTNMTATKNQVGMDGVANSATLLTATAANAKISQSITSTSVQRVFSLDIKRVTGTGTILLSLDDGATTTDITAAVNSAGGYTQQFAAQNNLNPIPCIILATSGDQVAVDFCQMCSTTIAGLNIPTQQRYLTTTATVLNSQSRPNAAAADAGPINAITKGAFGFFWQGFSERPTGGFIITSASNLFVSITGTGAVKFQNGPSGACQTADGVWKTGLGASQRNLVAGWCDASGLHLAANGALAGATTGTPGLDAAQDHWDLGTNGAGNNTNMGLHERFACGPNIVFTDAQLLQMAHA